MVKRYLRFFSILIATIIILSCSEEKNPVENIDNNESIVVFPDSSLEIVIREAINKPTGEIYSEDLLGLELLEASWLSISDLSGMEYCINLLELWIRNNNISDLSPLKDIVDLVYLDLNSNEIGNNLSGLSNLTNLEYLEIADNQISDISILSGLTKLKIQLDISRNQISDISPLANLAEIEDLALNDNQIGNVSALASLSNLNELDLDHNQVGDITPLLTCHNNGGLQSGSFVNITYNNMDLRPGTNNRNIVDQLFNAGVIVIYEDGNIVN